MVPSTIIYDINNIREEFDFHDFRLSFEFSMNGFGVHIIQEIEETDSRLDVIVKYDSISEKLFVDIDEIYNTYIDLSCIELTGKIMTYMDSNIEDIEDLCRKLKY
ncbi:MAG: hypothetical protein ACLRVD_09020 [Blautia caecimuris]